MLYVLIVFQVLLRFIKIDEQLKKVNSFSKTYKIDFFISKVFPNAFNFVSTH